MYTTKLIIGVEHRREITILISSNVSGYDMYDAHQKLKESGINIFDQCSELCDNTISYDFIKKLEELGMNCDNLYDEEIEEYIIRSPQEWVGIYIFLASTVIGDINYTILEGIDELCIGGYGLCD